MKTILLILLTSLLALPAGAQIDNKDISSRRTLPRVSLKKDAPDFQKYFKVDEDGLIHVSDVDGDELLLNSKGYVTVVVSSNEQVQDMTREASAYLDGFRGRQNFLLVVVVQLENSLGSLTPGLTIDLIRKDLDKEADRLQPHYTRNNSSVTPREDVAAVADFDGRISRALGWKGKGLHVVLFGPDGQARRVWNGMPGKDVLEGEVETLLDRISQNSSGI